MVGSTLVPFPLPSVDTEGVVEKGREAHARGNFFHRLCLRVEIVASWDQSPAREEKRGAYKRCQVDHSNLGEQKVGSKVTGQVRHRQYTAGEEG